MATDQDSTEKLREEILIDAQNDREKIINRARQEAEVILNNAATEADRVHQEQLDHAGEEAARRNELILATVSIETGRLRAARIEALLESVYEEVCRRLLARDGFEYRETVITLASHAINQMAGSAFVAKLPEADFTFLGDGLADEIVRRVGRPVDITVSCKQDFKEGGVIVEDAEGRQVWDNRLVNRLERLWPELRRQIAVLAAFVPKTGSEGDSP
jgi:vacuolar-type H+-ATPase subunit E/Vma4